MVSFGAKEPLTSNHIQCEYKAVSCSQTCRLTKLFICTPGGHGAERQADKVCAELGLQGWFCMY